MLEENLIVLNWTHVWTIIAGIFGIGAFFYKLQDKKFDKIDQKFDKIDQRFEKIDQKFDKIDQKIEHIGERMGKVENRMTAMETEMRGINQRLSNVESCVMPRKVFHFEETHKEEPKEN